MSQTIGRYQVEETIGRGGMGVVYKAFDPVLQRTVALKVLSGLTLDDGNARERLMREARAAGQLAHKNIIVIHDLGEDQGQPYIAMEFLKGLSLEAHLRLGPLPLELIIDVMVQVCDGLDYAHRRSIVHRDIKPANLFVTDSGDVKILDFGLVQIVSSSLTRSQAVMGTVSYMAPEQVRGERVDHRADLFAMGAVLYELVTRRKAFESDSLATTMYKILQEAPAPIERYFPGAPPPLASVIERALAKNADQRYQSAAEMKRDIEACRDGAPSPSRTATATATAAAWAAESAPTIVGPPRVRAAAAGASPPSKVWSPRRIRSTAIIGALLTAAFAGTLLFAPRDRQAPPSNDDAAESNAAPSAAAPTQETLPPATPPPATVSEQAPAVLPQAPPDQRQKTTPGAVSPSPQAAATPTAADRQAIAAAAARVEEARAAADTADAPALAAAQYRAATALEAEAHTRAPTSSLAEATARFVEAEARFRAAAIEARAEARLRAVEAQAAPRPSAPAPPVPAPEPPRAESKPAEPPARTPDADAPPRAADPKPPAEPPRSAAGGEAAVREIVGQYVAGLEARSMAALKRVWPTLSGAQERAIQAEFANARSVQVRFSDPRIEMNGDVATVTGVREYRLATQDGQQLATVTRTTLTLRRAGDTWHIERIVHQPR